MAKATIYLIPVPIADAVVQTLSPQIATHTLRITHYVVEQVRTARRFLKLIHPSIVIDNLQFSEMDKHNGVDRNKLQSWINAGREIGVMSEAGCPGIADPGAEVVAMAQAMGAKIIPLVGPNAIILALMASGLNGQSFAFNGYLPVKEPMRGQRIKELEQYSKKERQTQLFIETPYRNHQLLQDCLKHCAASTRLCIAQNITAPTEFISTKTIAEWKAQPPALEKAPAVFALLAG